EPGSAGWCLLAVAPQHDDDVGILLQATALTKSRELRFSAGIARRARQLRETDDDDAELARERLEVARDGRDLLHPVLVVIAGADELDVVHDDHLDLLVADRPARLRPELHDR